MNVEELCFVVFFVYGVFLNEEGDFDVFVFIVEVWCVLEWVFDVKFIEIGESFVDIGYWIVDIVG